jgi:hypothetical protein
MHRRLILQGLIYALVATGLIGFSAGPAYTHMDPGLALVKLSFSHAGQRKEDCRQLTPAEIAALPPNMRRPESCGRERVPLRVELDMDGDPLLRAVLLPSGLASDGAATVYHRFPVAAGRHEFVARLRDSRRSDGFDYEGSAVLELVPQQNLAIDFQPDAGGFLFLDGKAVTGAP